jgi:hypothetical protein
VWPSAKGHQRAFASCLARVTERSQIGVVARLTVPACGLHRLSCHCEAPAFELGRLPYRSSDMVDLLICGLLTVTGSDVGRVPFLLSRAGKTLLASGSEEVCFSSFPNVGRRTSWSLS